MPQTLAKIKGQRISTEPIRDLRFVRNVIYFDGPILSDQRHTFRTKWIDRNIGDREFPWKPAN